MTILLTQNQTAEASMGDLIETYNVLVPSRQVKRFESIEVGRARVNMLLLAAEDSAMRAGVPKGDKRTREQIMADYFKNAKINAEASASAKPAPVAADEKPRAAANPQATISSAAASVVNPDEIKPSTKASKAEKKEEAMASAKKPAAKKAPAKKTAAKKVAAKKSAAKKAPAGERKARTATYTKVRFVDLSNENRRPQADSKRSMVLAALKKRKTATLEQLTADVEFDVRPYVHKMVAVGWAEIVSAKE